MPKALSATIPDPLEARTRAIARTENRSMSNVVENALSVFTSLPKELRDELIARIATDGPEHLVLREASRRFMQILTQERLERALDAVATTVPAEVAFADADDRAFDDTSNRAAIAQP